MSFQATEEGFNGTESGDSDSGARCSTSFEENYSRLRIVTGIPDVRDIVDKFESQMYVKHNLISLINKMETSINEGRENRTEKQNRLVALKSRVETHNHE